MLRQIEYLCIGKDRDGGEHQASANIAREQTYQSLITGN